MTKAETLTKREQEIAAIVKGFDTYEDAAGLFDRLKSITNKLGIDPSTGQTSAQIREKIFNTIEDCISKFAYYDRKEDEDLPRGSIENAIRKGIITVDEIKEAFNKHIDGCFGED